LQQAVTELQMDALGQKALRSMPIKAVYAHRDDDPLWPAYALGRTEIALLMRAATIYGGTKQVQKNILAKQAFGL
jgi:alkylation response protein AidB-like acyl-CoA dehydrogenase